MDAPENFEIIDGRAAYRPVGDVSLARVIRMVTDAITCARERNCREILIVTTALTGFESPSITERYFFVQEWVLASGGAVRVAMVVRPDMIDPRKFGVTVAANRGLTAEVFASAEEAVAWLDGFK